MSTEPQHLELHISVDEDTPPLLDALAAGSKLSRQAIKQAMDRGALWLSRGKNTRRLRRVKTALQAGDTLHLYYDSEILSQQLPAALLISAEQGYGIWYKPYGMHCQGSKWGDHCTINRNVEKQTRGNTYLVHRLDRAASGLIIIAYEKRVAASFAERFRQQQIDKTYQAIVHGLRGTTEQWHKIDTSIEGKPAVSHVQTLRQFPYTRRSLVEIRIETGRKHQVRRHLADAGYPIVGDRLYGIEGDEENLQLCASRLAFTCPASGVQKSFELEPSLGLQF